MNTWTIWSWTKRIHETTRTECYFCYYYHCHHHKCVIMINTRKCHSTKAIKPRKYAVLKCSLLCVGYLIVAWPCDKMALANSTPDCYIAALDTSFTHTHTHTHTHTRASVSMISLQFTARRWRGGATGRIAINRSWVQILLGAKAA